ncbi:MAG TPA: ATP-binding cassette domain-containing protein, partial [Smithella sp.]|nr:ATP-binding cassette domain-containing protein [Smithella sp.]
MIYFRNVSLSFLDKKLFDNLNWTIHPKNRIGLVGENGAGKTTLFRMILGQVHPEAGAIEIAGKKNIQIGYLPQDLAELEPVPLMDFLKQRSGLAALEESIRDLERRLSQVRPNTSPYNML